MNVRGAIVAAAAAVALAACSSSSGAGGSPSAGPVTGGLDGRTFLSTAIEGRDLVPGTTVRLAFADGSVGASAGCNSMSGAYTISSNHILVPQMASTEMACSEALMAQDQWLAGLLRDAAIVLSGDTLRLATGGVTLTLADRRVADPDRPLEGTLWVLDGIVSGQAVSSVPAGVTATLRFADARVEVRSGCNTGGATAPIKAGTITFGAVSLTKMACQGDAMAVETAILAVLSGEVPWKIEASSLTLGSATGALMFRSAAASSPSA